MRYTSADDSMMLRRSALGPAQIAARRGHFDRASRGERPVNDAVSTFLRHGGSLGMLGDAVANKVAGAALSYGASAGATAAAGAASAAGYAAIGAAAGPIGAAAGLVVGLIAGKLLNKVYLNVGAMNNAEDNEVAAFNQYKQLGGTVAGRQIGLAAMTMVWKGALHSGFFPINHEKQCFHKGCSKYPGNASWVDTAINGGSRDKNCFPDVLPKFRANRSRVAQAAPVAPRAVNNMQLALPAPAAIAPRAQIALPRNTRGFGLSGLGDLAVSDAQDFIDNYFIPANAAMGNHWAVPISAMERQVLYDVADAYLANQVGGSSSPYLANPSTRQASGGGIVRSTTAGVQEPLPQTGGGAGVVQGGNVYNATLNPATGTYQVGYNPPLTYPGTNIPLPPSQQPPGIATAGLSNLPVWSYALVAAGIIFALAKPGMNPPKRRRRRR